MTINWYGQSCFRVESKGVSLLFDPFSKEVGLRGPRLNDNIFLVTHEHYDHNNVEGAPGEAFVIRGPGEYEKSGVYVEGILKTEKWEGRDGNKKQITKVISSKLTMLGERKKPALSEVERKEGREPGDEGDTPF